MDGTLLDTLADLAAAANLALEKLGFPVHPTEEYKYFVGDGVKMLAKRILPEQHRDEDTIRKCIALIRQQYSRCWAQNTKPYPQIPQLLNKLQKNGIPMTVLSNKPDDFTKLCVSKLLSDWSFKIIRGLNDATPKKPDPTAALKIAQQLQISPGAFVYLGDTSTDMQTANAAAMFPVGALWGFRDAKELKKNGAKVLVKEPLEVMAFFESNQ